MALEQELLELHQETFIDEAEPMPSCPAAPILLLMSPSVSLPVCSIAPCPPPIPLAADIYETSYLPSLGNSVACILAKPSEAEEMIL
jgi:hypothetical protein